MSELRLFLRRDSLRDGNDCPWLLRADDGHAVASGTGLGNLPAARRCNLVLAADLVNLVPATLPDLPPHRLQGLLPAAAEAHALAEAEQLHVAWLGRDEQGRSWLAMLDKAWLRATLDALRARGVAVAGALPESLLVPVEAGAWSLLRHADGAVARLGAWQGHALDGGEPPAGLRLALAGARPEGLDVYQGSALRPLDPAAWQAELGLPVRDRGAWSWREPAWPAGPDILQGAFRPRHGHLDWPRLARGLAWGLALLAGIQSAGMALDWALLAREQARLQTEMRGLAERALPAHSAVVDPAWQVAERLKALRAGDDEGGFLTLMSRIGAAWPAGVGAPRQVDYRDGTVTLRLDQADPAAGLAGLKDELGRAGLAVASTPAEGGLTLLVREGGQHGE